MPNAKKAFTSNGPISEEVRETTMMSLIKEKGKGKPSSGKSAPTTKAATSKLAGSSKGH